MATLLRFLLLLVAGVLCAAKDIPNCNYEDTVDLSNVPKLANGSYLYDKQILIPPSLVGVYDYEQLFQGERLAVLPHLRGCVCRERKCIRFCCHPSREEPQLGSRECQRMEEEDSENVPTANLRFDNGTVASIEVLREFVPVQGIPCVLKDTYSYDNYQLLENGSVAIISSKQLLGRRDYCLMADESNPQRIEWEPVFCEVPVPEDRAATAINISMAISIPFIVLTLLVYLMIPELQNLHGKCLISYLSALAAAWTLLVSFNFANLDIDHTPLCSAIGYISYFLFMSIFFWLNVISYDLWQSFRRTVPMRSGHLERFIYYSTYAWGIPLGLTVLMVILDHMKISDYFRPGIPDGCTIDNYKLPSVLYYTGINLAIVVADIVFFATTLYRILKMQRDIRKVMSKSDSKKNKANNEDRQNFALFFRLFLVMGITWLFDAASVIETLIHPDFHNPLYDITDFLNAFVGPITFICFILNRKTLGLIRKKYLRIRGTRDEETALNRSADEKRTSEY